MCSCWTDSSCFWTHLTDLCLLMILNHLYTGLISTGSDLVLLFWPLVFWLFNLHLFCGFIEIYSIFAFFSYDRHCFFFSICSTTLNNIYRACLAGVKPFSFCLLCKYFISFLNTKKTLLGMWFWADTFFFFLDLDYVIPFSHGLQVFFWEISCASDWCSSSYLMLPGSIFQSLFCMFNRRELEYVLGEHHFRCSLFMFVFAAFGFPFLSPLKTSSNLASLSVPSATPLALVSSLWMASINSRMVL